MGDQVAFVTVGGIKYPRISVYWKDIIGDASSVDVRVSKQLMCPVICTEGYLFDCFTESGEKYVRTFATWSYYEPEDEASFGDRNCFPVSVLTRESKRDLKIAVAWMEANEEERKD